MPIPQAELTPDVQEFISTAGQWYADRWVGPLRDRPFPEDAHRETIAAWEKADKHKQADSVRRLNTYWHMDFMALIAQRAQQIWDARQAEE